MSVVNKKHRPKIKFSTILDLRKAADALKNEQPHLPLILELVICGMSRNSIANLKLDSIKDGNLCWYNRNNVIINRKLTERQISILDEYTQWRRSRKVINDKLILARHNTRLKNSMSYFFPAKPERIRSDIRVLGNEIGLDFLLEIPDIHQAVIKHLKDNNVKDEYLSKFYKNRKDK